MLAFVTGASSGIGKEMAKVLARRGCDLILTARNEEKLFKARNEIINENKNINVKIITSDLEKESEVFELFEKVKDEKIDIFINNAGFGTVGAFWETDIKTEINMLKVNDLAMHILFKLMLKKMLETDEKGKYILIVSSLSGFMPGPKMSAYYATKSYMLNLTRGVYKELQMSNLSSKVNIGVLCPGPIYTNFCDRAGVIFKTPMLTSEYVAKYAINKMLEKKLVIIPGILNKCGHILAKVLPTKLIMIVIYKIQKRKKQSAF